MFKQRTPCLGTTLAEARGQNWYNDRQTDWARKKARTQAPWLLHLAGDWHAFLENEKPHPRPHMMRATHRTAVLQRFSCFFVLRAPLILPPCY